MFISRPRLSSYEGLPEMAAGGLHATAFELIHKYVSPGAKVLDLGSGAGAWAQRLHDASYSVTACDLETRTDRFEFPCHVVDLNQNFGLTFGNAEFDAVSIVEVIEHLENPRHIFRQVKSLLKKEELYSLQPLTPPASIRA
jgi:2-polyprenyl-3-methyl-5-hydroxy-6-metoxy-1,4-benzoquinol methylase